LKSIAIPAISSGIFGYPVEESAEVILKTVADFLKEREKGTLEKVVICLFDDKTMKIFEKSAGKLLGKK